ncbi:copper resistance protein CopC [uncultured Serinicoccus sp.]|uniref:copper resistance CopC family protein n=1 Tax=uncultured Serinicoccus sp. TaxID=735514 RepID=UPI002609C85D|nr:copper resistance protein CopC [uncultured Serinicoccus sp.]
MSSTRRSTALLAALALVALPLPAQAHDELTGSDPEDGATVEAGELDEVTMTFSGQIAEVGAAVTVTDPDGGSALEGEPEVEGTEVTQDLVDDLADGDYAVAWRVTSEDGHPISGEFGFTVTGGEEVTEEASPAPTPSEEPTEETSQEAQPEESSTEPEAEETTPEQEQATDSEESATADSSTAEASSGLPVWAWVLLAAGGVAVLALMAATWARGRR